MDTTDQVFQGHCPPCDISGIQACFCRGLAFTILFSQMMKGNMKASRRREIPQLVADITSFCNWPEWVICYSLNSRGSGKCNFIICSKSQRPGLIRTQYFVCHEHLSSPFFIVSNLFIYFYDNNLAFYKMSLFLKSHSSISW